MNKQTMYCLLVAYLSPISAFCAENQDRQHYYPVIEVNTYDNPQGPVLKLVHGVDNMYIFANGKSRKNPSYLPDLVSPGIVIDVAATRLITKDRTKPLVHIHTDEHTVCVYGSGHVETIKAAAIWKTTADGKTSILRDFGSFKSKGVKTPKSRL